MSYRPVSSRGVSPTHQRLYSRTSTPISRPSSAPRGSSLLLPGDIRRRSLSVGGMPDRRSSPSQARSGFPAVPASAPRDASRTYVADVNPTFCIDGSVRAAVTISDRVAWTAEYDGTLRIRSLPKGAELKHLPGRDGSFCSCLLYLAPYQRIWAGFQDGYLRMYDSVSTGLLKEMVQHSGGVNCLMEMEGTVYTGSVDWKIGQWNPQEGTFERLFYGHGGGVRCLTSYVGQTGAVMFSGSDDATIKAWDPYAPLQNEEDRACLFTFSGHDRAVLSLETIPALNQLWSGGEDTTVRVWNLETLQCAATFTGHDAPVSCFLAMESRMWSGDKHGHIVLWDAVTLSPLQEISSRMHGVRLGMVLTMQKMQPCTAWKVWTSGSNGFVQCWNAETTPIVFDHANRYKYVNRTNNELVEQLEQYANALKAELDAARQESGMRQDKDRVAAQQQTHAVQLLQSDNEYLRQRLQELGVDVGAGAPSGQAGDVTMPPQPSSYPSAVIPADGSAPSGGVAVTHLERTFIGSNWTFLLSEKANELRDTFLDEASVALGVPAAQISDVQLRHGSLIAEFNVAHPRQVAAVEMDRRLQSYGFPRLQELHDNGLGTPKRGLDAVHDTVAAMQRQLDECRKDLEEMQVENESLRRGRSTNSGVGRESNLDEERERILDDARQEILQLHEDNERLTREKANMESELNLLRDENDALLRILERDPHSEPNAADRGGSSTGHPHPEGNEAGRMPAGGDAFHKESSSAATADSAAAAKDAEIRRLTEQVDRLKGELEGQQYTVDYLKDTVAKKEKQRASLQEKLKEVQDEHDELRRRSEQQQQQQPSAAASGQRGGQPPTDVIDTVISFTPRTGEANSAEKEVTLVKTANAAQQQQQGNASEKPMNALERLLQQSRETPQEQLERLQKEVQRLNAEKDALEQRPTVGSYNALKEDHDALEQYVQTRLKPLVASLKRDRAERMMDVDRLTKELAQAQQPSALARGMSPEARAPAGTASTADADPNAATAVQLRELLHEQRMNYAKLKEEYDALKNKKQNADAAPPAKKTAADAHDEDVSALGSSATLPPDAGPSEIRAEYDALMNYLHLRLKPLISKLKRERSERQLDADRARRANAELLKLLNDHNVPVPQELAEAVEKPPMDTGRCSVMMLQEALRHAEEQVKRLQQENREKQDQLDAANHEIDNMRDALQLTQDDHDHLLEEDSERRVREEKMAEAVEAMKKALETQQKEQQATANGARGASSEEQAGSFAEPARPTEPTFMHLSSVGQPAPLHAEEAGGRVGEDRFPGMDTFNDSKPATSVGTPMTINSLHPTARTPMANAGAQAGPSSASPSPAGGVGTAAGGGSGPAVSPPGVASGAVTSPSANQPLHGAGSLEAQNMALSVRLADAEAVIADLQQTLRNYMQRLEAQRRETERLQSQLDGYAEYVPASVPPSVDH